MLARCLCENRLVAERTMSALRSESEQSWSIELELELEFEEQRPSTIGAYFSFLVAAASADATPHFDFFLIPRSAFGPNVSIVSQVLSSVHTNRQFTTQKERGVRPWGVEIEAVQYLCLESVKRFDGWSLVSTPTELTASPHTFLEGSSGAMLNSALPPILSLSLSLCLSVLVCAYYDRSQNDHRPNNKSQISQIKILKLTTHPAPP